MNARAKARQLVRALRVGDNSCYFGPKDGRARGMGTNGGCRCHELIEAALEEAMARGEGAKA